MPTTSATTRAIASSWYAPSSAMVTRGRVSTLTPVGEAVRVRRRVTALEADLVRALPLGELDEQVRVEGEGAVRAGVKLHEPAPDAVRIELLVPGAVERVGQIDPPSVPAHLDHLRSAVHRSRGGGG